MKSILSIPKRISLLNWLEIKLLRKLLYKRSQLYSKKYTEPMAMMAFDYIANEISIHGIYELDELETIFRILEVFQSEFSTGTACDIGANIGNHSRFFAKRFDRVLSFEPNPLIIDLLRYNTKYFPNITVHETALGNSESQSRLAGDETNLGSYSILDSDDRKLKKNHSSLSKEFQVQIRTLDSMIDSLINLQFIKIDVEGFEYQVLLGAAQSIREHRPVIAFEQWPGDFVNGKSKSIEYLESLGYRFYWQKNNSINKIAGAQFLAKIIQIIFGFRLTYIQTSNDVPAGHYSMLLAIHKSRDPRFQSVKPDAYPN